MIGLYEEALEERYYDWPLLKRILNFCFEKNSKVIFFEKVILFETNSKVIIFEKKYNLIFF